MYYIIINYFYIINNQEHPYFLVTPSIISVLTSISVFFISTEIVNFFYIFLKSFFLIINNFCFFICFLKNNNG